MKKTLIFLFVLMANVAFAQRTVTGLISDTNNQPIEGVMVSAKNCNAETVTDLEGKYSIDVPENCQTFEFSKEGFQVQAIDIRGDVVNLTLTSLSEVEIFDLSLEELMNMEVVSASNVKEKLSLAPATIIVITDKDISERGYTEFYDVLNDLPGFDLSRAFGDEEYYLYVRGYRKTEGDQMLFMIDGMVMNYLWSNNMNAMAQYPLSNIKQIEIVYGPASAIYGSNAFNGVINIITKKEDKSLISLITGANNTSIVDLYLNGTAKDVTFNFTGRVLSSDGYDLSDRQPFISSKLYTDPTLWNPFVETQYAGYSSPRKDYYFQGSASTNGLTIGFINWLYESGYGNEYAGDKVLNNVMWKFYETTIYAKYEKKISDKLNSNTLLKYRLSGAPGTAAFIERYYDGVDFSYWPNSNRAISFFQDFSYSVNPNLFFNFGVKYDNKFLQKILNEKYGPFINADSSVIYPVLQVPVPSGSLDDNNHYLEEERGVYTQLKYSPTSTLDIIGGLRYDYNNIYKEVFSPRCGVVYQRNNFTGKAFFGTAYLAPTARSLYGSWQGGIANPNLKPEKMQTFEGSVAYTTKNSSNGIGFYYNLGKDAIGKEGIVNVNIGKRKMVGAEFYSKWMFTDVAGFINKFKTDIYISYIKSEEDLANTGDFVETGNMAPLKIHLIMTAYLTKNISLSLQNRYIDKINTVASNPINEVDSWFVSDVNLSWQNIFKSDFSMSIKAYNIFNTKYFHPGYQEASAGENAFDNLGNHIESLGWYNSRLPQPERTILLQLNYSF